MFKTPNPETGYHVQNNRNDLQGTIFKSRNIDLDTEGYIKLSPAAYVESSSEEQANISNVDAILGSSTAIFCNSSQVFSGILELDGFTDRSGNTNSPSPNVEEDVVFFNETEVVSDGTLIKYRSASTTWTTVSLSGFSGSYPIAMTVWDSQGHLAVGNNNIVKFVNTSWAVNGTTLTLPVDYQVSSLDTSGDILYIGTRSKSGGEAKLFIVGQIQTGHDRGYRCGSFEIFSVKEFKSSVVCITSLGQLLRFNGGGFDQLAQLPIYNTGIEWADANNDYSTISNRAVSVDGDLIYINLSSDTVNGKENYLPMFPAGIWCYDDTNGSLYHKHSPSYTKVQVIDGSAVTVDATDNDFTLTSGNLNEVLTGMPVIYSPISTTIPELKVAQAYYIIKDSSTVFRLASTYSNAIAGTAIDISGVGTTFQKFFVFKVNDYGWTKVDNRNSVAVLNNTLFDSNRAGRIAFGNTLFEKQSTSSNSGIIGGICPFIPNRGYFVTPRLNSSQKQDAFNEIVLKYRPLDADEKIIIKYKDRDKIEYPLSSVKYDQTSTNWAGTWTSTTTFTTTVDLSMVVVGDEIEITAGVGSGHIAFVTNISVSTGTYTVTIDEAFRYAVSGDVFFFVVDNWKKIGEIDNTFINNDKGIYSRTLETKSKFLQVKVEMRGIGVTVEELIINNNTDKSVI